MAMPAEHKPESLTLDGKELERVRKQLLAKYPPKVARKRDKQIVVNRIAPDGTVPEVQSNVRTVPGLI
ncbi:MAG: hypothetical protein HY911_09875, partial [Desulfobacterales bacterium]|nr:hypothetical protein [Desulfobacterales bacterium]